MDCSIYENYGWFVFVYFHGSGRNHHPSHLSFHEERDIFMPFSRSKISMGWSVALDVRLRDGEIVIDVYLTIIKPPYINHILTIIFPSPCQMGWTSVGLKNPLKKQPPLVPHGPTCLLVNHGFVWGWVHVNTVIRGKRLPSFPTWRRMAFKPSGKWSENWSCKLGTHTQHVLDYQANIYLALKNWDINLASDIKRSRNMQIRVDCARTMFLTEIGDRNASDSENVKLQSICQTIWTFKQLKRKV